MLKVKFQALNFLIEAKHYVGNTYTQNVLLIGVMSFYNDAVSFALIRPCAKNGILCEVLIRCMRQEKM